MLIKLTSFLLITPSYPFYCSGCGVISSQSHAMFKTLWTFDQCQNHLATWSQPPISWNKTILQYPTSNTRLKNKLSWAKGLATRDSKSLWSKEGPTIQLLALIGPNPILHFSVLLYLTRRKRQKKGACLSLSN